MGTRGYVHWGGSLEGVFDLSGLQTNVCASPPADPGKAHLEHTGIRVDECVVSEHTDTDQTTEAPSSVLQEPQGRHTRPRPASPARQMCPVSVVPPLGLPASCRDCGSPTRQGPSSLIPEKRDVEHPATEREQQSGSGRQTPLKHGTSPTAPHCRHQPSLRSSSLGSSCGVRVVRTDAWYVD